MIRQFTFRLCVATFVFAISFPGKAQESPQDLSQYLARQGEQITTAFKLAQQNVALTPDLKSIHGLSLPYFANLKIAGTTKDYFAFNPVGQQVTAGYKFWDDAQWAPLPTYDPAIQIPNPQNLILLPANINMFLVEFRFGNCKARAKSPDDFPCSPPTSAGTANDSGTKAGGQSEPTNSGKTGTDTNSDACCILEAIFLRDLRDAANNLIPAVVISKEKMLVSETLIRESQDWREGQPSNNRSATTAVKAMFKGTFTIDGYPVTYYFPRNRDGGSDLTGGETTYVENAGWATGDYHQFELYPAIDSCRPYHPHHQKGHDDSLLVRRPGDDLEKTTWKDNGIRPDFPKVFDVFTLRQMLATTASQLAGISGFSTASITGAFGNIQGVTSDISYLSAQVTTVATPTVSSVVSNGNTGTNTVAGTSGLSSALTGSSTTINCPAGTLPGIGTSGLPACVLVINSASPGGSTSANPVGFSGGGNVNGGGSTVGGSTTNTGTTSTNSTTNVQGTNQANTTTTNSGGQAGTIAPVPVSNAPAAPTNIGVSSQDILAEQVQLNSQITTLRMALQGSLSDQYLIKEGKVVANRQQTTLGFNVFLDPLQRYKHAIAEVRVWIYPARSDDSMSVVNLLPASKTYNVAKITSSQKAFGAGVVIDPVNLGVAAGKTKNRLFLAKDTDTVALQYYPQKNYVSHPWNDGATLVDRSAQEHIVDVARVIEAWQKITNACVEDPGPNLQKLGIDLNANPLVFGWQFRPVLGADYVQSGSRQVFAQLALPVEPGARFSPLVFIQTRWREYDSKRQVVGPVYEDSCSILQDPNVIEVDSPLDVHTVHVDDMGSGIVKVSAEGRFFQQGFSVLSGPTTIGPAIFDGESIQFFANAANLLLMDDLQLAAEDGARVPLGVRPLRNSSEQCGMEQANLVAVPRPDGTSLIKATIQTGSYYNLYNDSPPHPLFLIGSQVYGLHETPPLESTCHAPNPDGRGPVDCTYQFLAPTDAIRTAQTFTARDLSWERFKKTGTIDFDPSFSGLATQATVTVPDSNNVLKPGGSSTLRQKPADVDKAAGMPVYTLSGTDLQRIANLNCTDPGCLQLYQGLAPFTLNGDNFQRFSKTTAALTLEPQTVGPYFTVGPARCHVCTITIADANSDAVIFYTDNGTAATAKSNAYKHNFTVKAPATINAIAFAPNLTPSGNATLTINTTGIVSGPNKPPTLPKQPKLAFKSYRLIWHPTFGDQAVEWDLSTPPPDTAAVAASQVVNEEDVTDITFNGVDVFNDKTTMNFSFDGIPLANPSFKYDGTKKALTFYITSDMTKKPGHKVILMNALKQGDDGSKQSTQVLLPFDVTRR